jgi:hypothetical protein
MEAYYYKSEAALEIASNLVHFMFVEGFKIYQPNSNFIYDCQ